MALLDQIIRAFTDGGGRPLPLLRSLPLQAKTVTLAAGAQAAVAVATNAYATPVRLWCIGTSTRYKFGTSGVVAPVATATGGDPFVGQDQMIETYMLEGETHIRTLGGGVGSLIIEVLG
jgi:hypothetical protein